MNQKKLTKILYIDEWPSVDSLSISGNGLGASIFKLAALSDAIDFQVELLTSQTKKDLLDQAEGIFKVYTEINEVPWSSYEQIILLGITEIPGAKPFDHFYPFTKEDRLDYKSSAHIDFWRRFSARALNLPIPSTPAQALLHINQEDLQQARKLLSAKGQWVALSTQVISALKDYTNWNEVIDLLLSKKINVLLIGNQNKLTKKHPQILNMCGQTDIALLKALIATADVFAGNDGLNANLALFLQTPAVILFSMISPEAVIDPHQELRSPVTPLVNNGCPHQYCYSQIGNYRNAECLWNREKGTMTAPIQCLQFKAKDIFEEIITLLSQSNAPL